MHDPFQAPFQNSETELNVLPLFFLTTMFSSLFPSTHQMPHVFYVRDVVTSIIASQQLLDIKMTVLSTIKHLQSNSREKITWKFMILH